MHARVDDDGTEEKINLTSNDVDVPRIVMLFSYDFLLQMALNQMGAHRTAFQWKISPMRP